MSEQVAVIEATRVPALADDAPLTPLAMLDRALSSGASVDVLTKLMDLSERWERNQARKAFDEAVSAAKAKIPMIVKKRDGHNSKYADIAALAKAVDPIISEFGLSYRFRSTQDERIHVTCILSHRAGHSEENTLSGPADTTGSKNAIQAIGSTLTYLQRYTLTQALGLAASIDDDGNAAGGGAAINDQQLEELQKRITATKANINLFCKFFKIDSLPDLPATKYDEAITFLKQKAEKQGATT